MASDSVKAPLNPFRVLIKGLGSFADVSTRRGKAVKRGEGLLTEGMMRLAGNEAYLRLMGTLMQRSFVIQAQTGRAIERGLRAWRVPSARELHEVHSVTASMDDKLDALSCQMEMLIDHMVALDARISALEGQVSVAAPQRRVSRRQGGEA